MLKVENIRVAYGPIEVLKGVSLKVSQGQIISLIGANGAGKTTILNTISGLLAPASGDIIYRGQNIAGKNPEDIVKLGIAQVPEGRKVFKNLTVYECLLMGGLTRKDKKAMRDDIDGIYEMFPRLGERRKQLSGTLSGGEQEMLAFGRALMAKPDLLLLDEPSMGLAPQLVEEVAKLIVKLRGGGKTILLVEQNAELALSISDHGYVLETGEMVFSQPACDLLNNEEVRKSYLGL